MNGRLLASAVLAVALVSVLASGALAGRAQEKPQASVAPAAEKAPAQPVVSGPMAAKERTAVFVLLAWVWLSIAVLLWLVRLRVREADRVFRLGLDRALEKRPKDSRT